MSNIFKLYDTLSTDIINYSKSESDLGNIPSPFIISTNVISSITTYDKKESEYVTSLITQLTALKTRYENACGSRGIATLSLQPKNCQKAKTACELIISILNRVQDKYQRLKNGGKRQTRRRYSKHNKNRKQNLRSRRRRNKQA